MVEPNSPTRCRRRGRRRSLLARLERYDEKYPLDVATWAFLLGLIVAAFVVFAQTETLIALVGWSNCAETPASSSVSASCYGIEEDIGIFAVIVTPRKRVQVQRQILFADMMEATHNTALQKRPERISILRV